MKSLLLSSTLLFIFCLQGFSQEDLEEDTSMYEISAPDTLKTHFVGFTIGLNSSLFMLNERNGIGSTADSINQWSINPLMSYIIGMQYVVKIKEHLFLETGLKVDVAKLAFHYAFKNQERSVKSSFSHLEIPLLVRYSPKLFSSSFFGNAGINYLLDVTRNEDKTQRIFPLRTHNLGLSTTIGYSFVNVNKTHFDLGLRFMITVFSIVKPSSANIYTQSMNSIYQYGMGMFISIY